jgi:hypothetical protein
MAESKSDYEVSPADHATHPLQEGVVRRTGGRPRPSASEGADAISRNSYFRPTSSAAQRRQRTVAGPQNRTAVACALIHLGSRCASPECGLIFLHGYRW